MGCSTCCLTPLQHHFLVAVGNLASRALYNGLFCAALSLVYTPICTPANCAKITILGQPPYDCGPVPCLICSTYLRTTSLSSLDGSGWWRGNVCSVCAGAVPSRPNYFRGFYGCLGGCILGWCTSAPPTLARMRAL